MRESGRLLAVVFAYLDAQVVEGVSTMSINNLVEDYILSSLQARPASKGQYGYQYVLNTSVNQVVCHGVPSSNQHLKSGDIVNVDITLEKNGFIADGWTVVTSDKKLSAQWEHTIAVTTDGFEVLTLRDEEKV